MKNEVSGEIIGKTFKNIKGYLFKVLKKDGRNKSGQQLYRVRFENTKYECTVTKQCIKEGAVRDRFEKSVLGIGYIGNATTIGHEREHMVWSHMLDRCYNKNNKKDYPSYGKIGVKVCDRWHSLENFIHDVPLVDGFNKELFDAGKLTLDKDAKQLDISHKNRIYSLETCKFITIEENTSYRDTQKYSKKFMAISPDEEKQFVVGIKNFCNKYGFDSRAINARLSGRLTRPYHGWRFFECEV